MTTFYTLDRSNRCTEQQVFNPQQLSINFGITTDNSDEPTVISVSSHGMQYLNKNIFRDPDGPSTATELIFELVRSHHFPNKPTRLRCMFVTDSLEDAQHFKNQFWANRPYKIFSIEYDGEVHRGDMRLLSIDGTIIEIQKRAMAYWCGETYPLHPGYEPYWETLIPLPAQLGQIVEQWPNPS